jgi:hypothetical protein
MFHLVAGNFVGDTTERKGNLEKSFPLNGFPRGTEVPKLNLTIFLDSTYTFPSDGFAYENLDKTGMFDSKGDAKPGMEAEIERRHKRYFGLHRDYVSARPILFYNPTDKPALLAYWSMIQEALDTDGKWKPIEYRLLRPGGCVISDSVYFHVLKPKHYVAFPAMKYNGDYKTKIRIKCEINGSIFYSNPITAYINRSQFDKRHLPNCFRNSLAYISLNGNDEYFLAYAFMEK